MQTIHQDTIVAIATPQGEGAIGIIRLSGPNAIHLADTYFYGSNLLKAEGNTVHYGKLKDDDGKMLDECLATVFKAPRSYTKEDVVEFACHGSSYILKSVIKLFLTNGARLAEPGEFTMRAYLNGQMDLSQAEAVADLIASNTASQHALAMDQMRGGFSKMIAALREKLIEFASLIELENDFSEEDVEFADRDSLKQLVQKILRTIRELKQSFDYGNAIKEGIPVAIIGKPNVGKSTLLNALLNEDKAIISAIPGTTRDVIEDTIQMEGLLFRFIDTAGIRETEDTIESLGIARSKEQLAKANIVICVSEIQEDHPSIVQEYKALGVSETQHGIIVLNKTDTFHACHAYDVEEATSTLLNRMPVIAMSAKEKTHLGRLQKELVSVVQEKSKPSQTIVSNLRHYEALDNASTSLEKVIIGLDEGISSDFVAMDIRHALQYLGEISGEISTDDLLDSIFSNFCIGK